MKVPTGTNIYVEFGNIGKLPINPEEIKISQGNNNKTHETLGQGEIVVVKKPALKEISWDGFISNNADEPFNNGSSPSDFVTAMQSAMENKEKGRVVITRSGLFDTSISCIVSEFNTTDKGGEPDSVYYSVTFQEYRTYSAKKIAIKKAVKKAVAASAETVRDTSPVLRVGAKVIANGKYWYTSAGAKPYGVANNLQTEVTRIVPGRQYGIHIGHYGWLSEGQLQVIG